MIVKSEKTLVLDRAVMTALYLANFKRALDGEKPSVSDTGKKVNPSRYDTGVT